MPAGVTFYGKRTGYTIHPINEAGETELERVPAGKLVEINIVQRRNTPSLNLFWAIADAVAKAMQAMGREDADKEWVGDQLKVATGHCRAFSLGYRMRMETGQEWGLAPKSIDFASMDQIQFAEFLDRVTGFIVTDLLPHIPTGEMQAKIDSLLDPQQRRAYRLAKGLPE